MRQSRGAWLHIVIEAVIDDAVLVFPHYLSLSALCLQPFVKQPLLTPQFAQAFNS